MKVGIGQDSHRFDFEDKKKHLILAGVVFDNHTPLSVK
jgi:2-C-methyl-D-erythritol 2,4-cyclodiphosphate synthase